MRHQLSAECALVFRSADPSCGAPEYAALANSVRDWPRVLVLAELESAASTLWRALRASGANLPPEIEQHASVRAVALDLRQQYLARRTAQTVDVFHRRGIPFLLLKGAAVGALVDPTFRMRSMTDIDILVHREDCDRAREALIAAGWPETTDPVLLELLRDAHHLPHFVDPQMPDTRVELHVALMPADQPFSFSEADLWRDAREAPPPFTGARIPSPEHLVLHASLHFAWQHTMAFGAWRTFRLIALLVRRPGFDWDALSRDARRANAATSCYWTLRLLDHVCGVAVPPPVLEELAPPTPEWVQRSLERHIVAMIAPGEMPSSPSVTLSRLLWRAALRPRWSGYASPGRWDPEHRWETARGTASTETALARVARHVRNFPQWMQFVTKTLI
ncbi:MAG TPA: nucleotidyltransferase family protein [Gemmatimonadaceae bacterium]|nr:nucleotidyltransferase family protein [Gemmatimonadaceae bacterium]